MIVVFMGMVIVLNAILYFFVDREIIKYYRATKNKDTYQIMITLVTFEVILLSVSIYTFFTNFI